MIGPHHQNREQRRQAVRRHHRASGIDQLRIRRKGHCLWFEILFIPPWPGVVKSAIPERLTASHLRIFRDEEPVEAEITAWEVIQEEFVLRFRLCPAGTFHSRERWRLRIVEIEELDEEFVEIDFLLEIDLAAAQPAPLPVVTAPPAAPVIDYLSKDYESFRRTVLERMRRSVPNWRETSEADLGVMLAEILAYAGDRLSYWQDAVATETYLATARLRASAVRHARLLDYLPKEGCAPRVWVQIRVDADGVPLPAGSTLLTSLEHQPTRIPIELYRDRQLDRFFHGVETFYTLRDATLFSSLQTILIRPPDTACDAVLPAGATEATVIGNLAGLVAGNALLLEAMDASETPTAAHVVELASDPEPETGQACEASAFRIQWKASGALPYDFPLRRRSKNGLWLENLSLFRGNLVRAELGRRITDERLPPVPETGKYRPQLLFGPVLYGKQEESDENSTVPRVQVMEVGPAGRHVWRARPTLLRSHSWSRDLVVENGPTTVLRFGDGVNGRLPSPGTEFTVSYRVGDIRRGAVSPGAIRHIVTDDERFLELRNPVAAEGGAEPESTASIRRMAPEAHLAPMRCVTVEDYVERCRTFVGVRDAAAHIRPLAGHNRVTVYVDRQGEAGATRDFRASVRQQLEPFRLLGTSIHVRRPDWFSIFLELRLNLKPQAVRTVVSRWVRDILVGSRGLFAPGSFGFGQPVLAGRILEAVMRVEGVDSVVIERLAEWTEHPHKNQERPDSLTPGPHSIIRLADDVRHPDHGQLLMHFHGGRE